MYVMNNKLYKEQNKKDIVFGNNQEKINIIKLNDYFKINLQHRNKNDIIDFIDTDNKIICELKGRRVNKCTYKDTIISMIKLYESIKYINMGYKCFFVFSFNDTLCYYQFNGTINNKWVKVNGRCDRGKYEYDDYYHINTELLKDIIK